MKTDIRTLIRLSCFVSNTWDNLLLMPCAVCISEKTNIKTSVWDSIYTNIQFHITLLTYLIAILIKTDIVAIPRPLPETRMISTNSLLRLKYWPIINVAGSRVIATPIPKCKRYIITIFFDRELARDPYNWFSPDLPLRKFGLIYLGMSSNVL